MLFDGCDGSRARASSMTPAQPLALSSAPGVLTVDVELLLRES
jgi:hypothetical protein